MMSFTKADMQAEREELERLVNNSEEARSAYKEFMTQIDLQRELVALRKSENMTQKDLAVESGLTQQAISRIECGSGATINSLLKYLSGMGYSIEFRKII